MGGGGGSGSAAGGGSSGAAGGSSKKTGPLQKIIRAMMMIPFAMQVRMQFFMKIYSN